jgi:hypothetical protein
MSSRSSGRCLTTERASPKRTDERELVLPDKARMSGSSSLPDNVLMNGSSSLPDGAAITLAASARPVPRLRRNTVSPVPSRTGRAK